MQLYTWRQKNKGLGTFAFELVDEVIRRLPERLGADEHYQDSQRRQLLDHPGADKYWKKPPLAQSPNPAANLAESASLPR